MPEAEAAALPRGRVVIVDDDEFFRESLESNLTDSGFEVTAFGDGASVLAYLRQSGTADLMLLDWKMPAMSGIEVLRHLREAGAEVPVIFLTALSDQIYEEAALIGGAIDFVEKSRSFSILLKRIELIRGGAKADPSSPPLADGARPVRCGELELRPQVRRAYWKTARVELSLSEFAIVHYLAARAGSEARYRELYDAVRGAGFMAGHGAEGYRGNVRTFIKRIRKKFREIDEDFDQIENYPGFGYRWRDDRTVGA